MSGPPACLVVARQLRRGPPSVPLCAGSSRPPTSAFVLQRLKPWLVLRRHSARPAPASREFDGVVCAAQPGRARRVPRFTNHETTCAEPALPLFGANDAHVV